jgi:hypothetical protein
MLTDKFSQGHVGFYTNPGQLCVTTPVAQEVRAVFLSQGSNQSVAPLFLDLSD